MVGLREPLAFCGVLARSGAGTAVGGGLEGQKLVPLHSFFPDCRALFLIGLFLVVGLSDVYPPQPIRQRWESSPGPGAAEARLKQLRGAGRGEPVHRAESFLRLLLSPLSFQVSFWKSPRWKPPSCGRRQKSWSRTASCPHHRLPHQHPLTT